MLLLSWLEVTLAVLILANPRCAVSAADTAHGVEGFAGDGVGHSGRIPQCVQTVDGYTTRIVFAHDDQRKGDSGHCGAHTTR